MTERSGDRSSDVDPQILPDHAALYWGSLILSSIFQWSATDTIVLAQIIPEAATAGIPIPGKVESPQHRNPSRQVACPSSIPSFGRRKGPYVPLSLRRNLSCVSGVPISVTFARSRTSGICRSIAAQSTPAASSFFFLYSGDARSIPSQSAYGSVAGTYACRTWHPGGASDGSSSDAIDTSTRFRGASTPAAQSSRAAHCAGNAAVGAAGSPAPSMPTCRCRKESHRSTRASRASSCAARSGAVAASTRRRVDQRSALETTARRARMVRPSRVRTPAARPFSTRSSATWALSSTWHPSCLVTPRTRASTIAREPPLG
mmetsp:Transcript_7611/g.15830  ORF Transcript_7611/g.15830 Transcript_7611/m.15830 type:complete len:317 (+) Transcript_7611:65-1015(+)